LVNIIAGKSIVPELIQSEANPDSIAALAEDLLNNRDKREAMQADLSKIRDKLGTPGAAERAALIVYNMLKG